MARESDVKSVITGRITLGQSLTYLEIAPEAGMISYQIKLLSGGTLEIGGVSVAGGTFTHGAMYPLGINEVYSCDLSGKFALYCSGATCVAAFIKATTMPA